MNSAAAEFFHAYSDRDQDMLNHTEGAPMNMRSRIVMAIVLASGCGLCVRPAAAWNSPGHMIIALVAFDQMDAPARETAISLLRDHPRYADHFERLMPREVSRGSDTDKDRWCFAHAATWPDLVRDARDSRGAVTRADSDRYNRPWWHFINEPIYLSADDERLIAGSNSFNTRRDPSDDQDDENMNIVQAVKNSSQIVRDEYSPTDKRAVHLCWLLHLVGDAHQPLHAVTLVSARRFPQGDHGGNFLDIQHDWKLHAFWDDQVATVDDFATLVRLTSDVEQNAELAAAGKKAESSLDPGVWIDESHEIATKFGYTPEVIKKIAAREGHTHLGPLDLSERYKADAERLSEQRAIESGHRLAKLLEELLRPRTKLEADAKPQATTTSPTGSAE
jgi:S1/P1 Nuclease